MGSLQFFCEKRIRSEGVNLNNLLPHEVVSDILSRLPVTSLPQVKLTCKLWYSLVVDDPSFPSKHLTHAVRNPGHLYTLIGRRNFHFAEKQSDTTAVSAIRLPRQVENNDLGEDTLYFCKQKRTYVAEYASCHGLVCHCLIEGQSIYVFNPMISEHVRLPDRPLPSTLKWGFGFAPVTNKYKCYCYSSYKPEGDEKQIFSSALYTLGDGESWREIGSPPFPKSMSREHIYCKGALYWAILKFHKASRKFEGGYNVLSLDLETETFRERRFDYRNKSGYFNLTVIGETVAAVLCSSGGYAIFFLIDEGKDIWELKYTIPYRISVKKYEFMYQLELLGLWMNQELYCREEVTDNTSKDYDVKCFFFRPGPGENKFSAFRLPFANDVHGKEITPQLILPHVGSLVSPIKIMNTGKQQLTSLS